LEKFNPKPEYDLPFSAAAERNKDAILEKLQHILDGTEFILEVGSGTGQHAIHFANKLPDLTWQPTDLKERLTVTDAVLASANLNNIKKALSLDVRQYEWPNIAADVIYTSNTLHIMSWEVAQKLIIGAAQILPEEGLLIIYGPFNYEGEFTSESNKMFDGSLKKSNPEQGIRDFEGVEKIANMHNLDLQDDFTMPANNRLLVFVKV